MSARDTDILQGTLDVLVLKALTWGPVHGYAVARWIEQVSDDALQVEEGSLYPALHRLAERGLAVAEWGISENNRRARYYRLTARGRQHLKAEGSRWARYAEAVSKVLRAVEHPV
jgi:PadR family transcriptional regulator PadR